MPVAPEAVWSVLADPETYADWVVGSQEIRDADPAWPSPGSRFHHRVGIGPLTVADHTRVVQAREPHLLKLRAHARPLGVADVTLRLVPDGDGGTLVRMDEYAAGLYALLNFNPLTHLLTRARNAQSLARLERLALDA